MSFLGGGDSNSDNKGSGSGSKGGSPYQMSKAKKESKKNTGGGPLILQAAKAVGKKLSEASKAYNIKTRKKYISKYNKSVPPSERIDMSDEQIGSSEGLVALRETGYQTNQDRIDGGGGGNQPILGSEIQKTAVKKAPDGPTIPEMAQLEETEEERLLRTKRKGRKSTKLAQADDELTLSKKVLLG